MCAADQTEVYQIGDLFGSSDAWDLVWPPRTRIV